ncbi:MAG TPA: glycosyltransferase family 39 protein, partial [Anaerolineae bacterium]|nr:glycosyltransferase family 39 protein [Anaerolineae bacterium]
MQEKHWLGVILGSYFVLGLIYATVTPIFEASDELWHYPMVRHLADGNPLPVQGADYVGPWKQQASQPPLYYYVAAGLTWWIDTSDMETVRYQNPHVDNGVITADGNINLVVHDREGSTWQGTLLAVRIVRYFSVLLGLGTVYLTYLIGRMAAPRRPEVGLGGAAVTAFTPMFLFISGAVNNDNLVMVLAALALWLMMRTVAEKRLEWKWLGLIGLISGAGALAKFPALALAPMGLGTIFIARWAASEKDVRIVSLGRLLGTSLRDWVIFLVPMGSVAGWWYWRNKQLYGDWLGWSAFFDVLGVRATPASLAQLWDERWGFMLSYWGL